MVGAAGFEPTTSCSQSTRAAKLRHAPSPVASHAIENPQSQGPDGETIANRSRCDAHWTGRANISLLRLRTHPG